jgi:hypothetical protein
MIDRKIQELREITDEFPFIEYYSHTKSDCYKILNEFTDFREDKIVLCDVNQGFYKAVDIAVTALRQRKNIYFKTENAG